MSYIEISLFIRPPLSHFVKVGFPKFDHFHTERAFRLSAGFRRQSERHFSPRTRQSSGLTLSMTEIDCKNKGQVFFLPILCLFPYAASLCSSPLIESEESVQRFLYSTLMQHSQKGVSPLPLTSLMALCRFYSISADVFWGLSKRG